MQLHALALYSHDGHRRILRLKPGALNVISGHSTTGKTALLDIVDYCFGRSGDSLPTGRIRENVSWYGVLLGDRHTPQLMVARPVPSGQTSVQAMLRAGVGIDLPEPEELEVNADRVALRGALDRMLGLGGFDIEQHGAQRDRLRASVSHAIQFCLQKQLELMSDRYLFHRQDDRDVAPDFEALFPYFVGAVDEQTLQAQRQAVDVRKRLRGAEQRYARADAAIDDLQRRDAALLIEARKVGLLSGEPEEESNARALLRTITQQESPPSTGTEDFAARQRQLRRALQDARAELRRLREHRAAVDELGGDRDAHLHALDVQAGRLGMVKALPSGEQHDSETCVLCGNRLGDPDETARALLGATATLEAQIADLRSGAKDVNAAERVLDERIAQTEASIETLGAQLEASVDGDEATRSNARAVEQQAYLRGVIAEHVRVAELTSSDRRPALAAEIKELERTFAELSEGLDVASINQRVDDRLDAAAVNMTDWARQLKLEWANEGLVRIDRGKLTVAVQRPSGKVLLQNIGSGANHVGYHLVAHLALHDFFISQRRPVPRFLFIDQPSLPHFPTVQDKDAAVNDVDWQAVKHYFELARDVVARLDGELQVLITDHAMYEGEKWFDDALVADWHHGERLVPEEWPKGDAFLGDKREK